MQRHLHIDDGGDRRGGGADIGELRRLEAGQRVRAGEMDQEQVILDEEVPERGLRQRAPSERPDEIMRDIAVPYRPCVAPETAEQALVEGQRYHPSWPTLFAGSAACKLGSECLITGGGRTQ